MGFFGDLKADWDEFRNDPLGEVGDLGSQIVGVPSKLLGEAFPQEGEEELAAAAKSAEASAASYQELVDIAKEQWADYKEFFGPESTLGKANIAGLLDAIENFGPGSDVVQMLLGQLFAQNEFFGPESEISKLQRDDFKLYSEIFGPGSELLARQLEDSRLISDLTGPGSDQFRRQLEDFRRFSELTGPQSTLFQGLVGEAEITPERITAARARATADVESEYTRALDEQERRNLLMGIDPSSPAAQAQRQRLQLGRSTQRVGASNTAALNERRYRTGLGLNISSTGLAALGPAPTAVLSPTPTPGLAPVPTAQIGQSPSFFLPNPAPGSFLATGAMQGILGAGQGLGSLAGTQYAGAGVANQPSPFFPNFNFTVKEGGHIRRGFGLNSGRISVPRLPGAGNPEDRVLIPAEAHRADEGGRITGPGTETSDSVPALLSTNEYVIPAFATTFYGTDKFDKMVEKARQGSPDTPRRIAGEPPQAPGFGMMGGQHGGQVEDGEFKELYGLKHGGEVHPEEPPKVEQPTRVDRFFEHLGDVAEDLPGNIRDALQKLLEFTSIGEPVGRHMRGAADGGSVIDTRGAATRRGFGLRPWPVRSAGGGIVPVRGYDPRSMPALSDFTMEDLTALARIQKEIIDDEEETSPPPGLGLNNLGAIERPRSGAEVMGSILSVGFGGNRRNQGRNQRIQVTIPL